jgi:hypothetical protein
VPLAEGHLSCLLIAEKIQKLNNLLSFDPNLFAASPRSLHNEYEEYKFLVAGPILLSAVAGDPVAEAVASTKGIANRERDEEVCSPGGLECDSFSARRFTPAAPGFNDSTFEVASE